MDTYEIQWEGKRLRGSLVNLKNFALTLEKEYAIYAIKPSKLNDTPHQDKSDDSLEPGWQEADRPAGNPEGQTPEQLPVQAGDSSLPEQTVWNGDLLYDYTF